MTPKEKAASIVDKFQYIDGFGICDDSGIKGIDFEMAKQCALIAVDEIINILEGLHKPEYTFFDIYEPKQFTISDDDTDGYMLKNYFQEVKTEIEKL